MPGRLSIVFLIAFMLHCTVALAPCPARSVSDLTLVNEPDITVINATDISPDRIMKAGGTVYVQADLINDALLNAVSIDYEGGIILRVEGGRTCEFTVDSPTCLIDGERFILHFPVLYRDGNFFVPAVEYSKIFGALIDLPPAADIPDKYGTSLGPQRTSLGLQQTSPPDSPAPEWQSKPDFTLPESPEAHAEPSRENKVGVAFSLALFRPEAHSGGSRFKYSRKTLAGFTVSRKMRPRFALAARYEWGEHGATVRLPGRPQDGVLTLDEQYYSLYLKYLIPGDKARPFLTLGYITPRVTLFYHDPSIAEWRKSSPDTFELAMGADYRLHDTWHATVKLRWLKGSESVFFPGLGRQITLELDDIVLEVGTTYYF